MINSTACWPLDEEGETSVKLQQAVELINSGTPLQILKESEWLRLLGLEHRERDVHRLFTPAMLQQKLDIPRRSPPLGAAWLDRARAASLPVTILRFSGSRRRAPASGNAQDGNSARPH